MATFVSSAPFPKIKELLPRDQVACQAHRSVQHVPSYRPMKCPLQQSAGNTRCVGIMARATAGSSSSEDKTKWGEVFEWEIKGAGEKEVWAVTGDFLGVARWVPDLIERCERVEGEPQKPGCVRKSVLYPEPYSFLFEKLLFMDEPLYHYTYSIVEGSTTAPGFSLLEDYVGTFKLLPGKHKGTLLRWGYSCRPVTTLTQEKAHTIVFSLFQAAVAALQPRLSLPDDSITLISQS